MKQRVKLCNRTLIYTQTIKYSLHESNGDIIVACIRFTSLTNNIHKKVIFCYFLNSNVTYTRNIEKAATQSLHFTPSRVSSVSTDKDLLS